MCRKPVATLRHIERSSSAMQDTKEGLETLEALKARIERNLDPYMDVAWDVLNKVSDQAALPTASIQVITLYHLTFWAFLGIIQSYHSRGRSSIGNRSVDSLLSGYLDAFKSMLAK